MKCFVTVDISDEDINDTNTKNRVQNKLDIIRTISLELIQAGIPTQLKITNLPVREK